MNRKIITTVLVVFRFLIFQNVNAQDVYAGKNTKVEKDISAEFPFESKFIHLGTDTVHYVESGEGAPDIITSRFTGKCLSMAKYHSKYR